MLKQPIFSPQLLGDNGGAISSTQNGSYDLPSGEYWELLSVDLGFHWLPGTRPWPSGRLLPWQEPRVQFGQFHGLCLNTHTCMALRRWDLGMGYGWELSVYCPEALLHQSMAQSTCGHTLMCRCTYFYFVSEWQGSQNPLFYEDASASAMLCLSACLRVHRGAPPRGRVKSVLPPLRYEIPACLSGPSSRPTSTLTPRTSSPLQIAEEDSDIKEPLQHPHQE